ncbi:hypothetical protein GCM10020254_04580 [Streptomyces goshikiensis]
MASPLRMLTTAAMTATSAAVNRLPVCSRVITGDFDRLRRWPWEGRAGGTPGRGVLQPCEEAQRTDRVTGALESGRCEGLRLPRLTRLLRYGALLEEAGEFHCRIPWRKRLVGRPEHVPGRDVL